MRKPPPTTLVTLGVSLALFILEYVLPFRWSNPDQRVLDALGILSVALLIASLVVWLFLRPRDETAVAQFTLARATKGAEIVVKNAESAGYEVLADASSDAAIRVEGGKHKAPRRMS